MGFDGFFLLKSFVSSRKSSTFALAIGKKVPNNAEIAQLVEHNLAKVGVASSSLVFRSPVSKAGRSLSK